MSKILVIGVGTAGRNTVKRIKDVGIPDANYISFTDGWVRDIDPDIPNFSLYEMYYKDGEGCPAYSRPEVMRQLTEKVQPEIKEIIEYYFSQDASSDQ